MTKGNKINTALERELGMRMRCNFDLMKHSFYFIYFHNKGSLSSDDIGLILSILFYSRLFLHHILFWMNQ